MFVARLTEEQIKKYFGQNTTSFMVKTAYGSDAYLYVSYESDTMCHNHRLYDFEGSTVPSEESWRRYLYSIFGDEYYKAYASYLESQKENKLKALSRRAFAKYE